MPEQWYWKHRGDLLGPLDTDVLAELIRKRRRDSARRSTAQLLVETAVEESGRDNTTALVVEFDK